MSSLRRVVHDASEERPLPKPPRQPDDRRSISDAELSLLKLLWSRGPTTPSELHAHLTEQGATWAYPTVQTLLHRMLEKGYVERERDGRNQIYRAKLDQVTVVAREMDQMAQKFCDGSRSPLLQGLIKTKGLTRQEIDELRSLLDERAKGSGK